MPVNGGSEGEWIAEDGHGEVAAHQVQQNYVDRRPELAATKEVVNSEKAEQEEEGGN